VLGAELELVDEAGDQVPDGVEGELVVRGDHVMAGYWGLEDATGKALRDGALWTGDMARRTEDGYVTIIEQSRARRSPAAGRRRPARSPG
jgi:long-chain acyl-CoA synthetase